MQQTYRLACYRQVGGGKLEQVSVDQTIYATREQALNSAMNWGRNPKYEQFVFWPIAVGQ